MSDQQVNKSIYDKIIDKGSQEALEILNQGKQKAEALYNELISEANKEANRILNKNNEQNKNKIKTFKSEIERLNKKEILFKKKELINELFLLTLSRLKALDDEKLINYVINHLKKENLTGNEIIKVNKNDYSKYLSLFSTEKPGDLVNLDKLNQMLGKNINLKLSKEAVDIEGGFILVSDKYDINLSFESILKAFLLNNETEIANILFKEE